MDANDRKPEKLRVQAMDALTLVVDSVAAPDLNPVGPDEVAKLSLEGVPVTLHDTKVYLEKPELPRQTL